MSDTPRTEAEVNRQKCWSDDLITIDANFACQLERELNAAKQRIKRLEETGDALYENSYPTRWDLPEANARKLTEQEAWLKAKEDKL